MAAAPPRTEANLDTRIVRALRARYGHRMWTMKPHRATPTRPGLPDRIVIVDGIPFVWELKLPGQTGRLRPRQARELDAAGRAGAHARVITTVQEALDDVQHALESRAADGARSVPPEPREEIP